jgi:ATP-dependent exoDNAse (exonuclease V) alpha subunit
MTNLTPQQQQALKAIGDWYSDIGESGVGHAPPFYLAGPAGTGKTTLAREVGDALWITGVQFGAYTGKAASVLRGKGCTPASTLHSLLYKPFKAAGKPVEFIWNVESELHDADLLILDEVSMVDAELAADVERFNIPVLVLGDPEQLEPIAGEGHYTKRAPDFRLTETHRFFIDGPVGKVATAIRESDDARFGLTRADVVEHSVELAMEHDQILCWRNATRWMAIEKIRARLGRPTGVPVAGDRIMCLTNNKTLGVFNGEQFTVRAAERVYEDDWTMSLTDDSGVVRTISALDIGFTQAGQASVKTYLGGRGSVMYATFSQAITVHKAQGSQWDSVYVVNEAPALRDLEASRQGREAGITAGRRWLYTASTRAAERVTITLPRR